MKQLTIIPFIPPVFDSNNRLETKARAFHRKHPDVFEKCEQLMVQALRRLEKCGIALVWERMRWHYAIDITTLDSEDNFKLNNNHRAYYARWLLYKHPEWAERLDIRELKT